MKIGRGSIQISALSFPSSTGKILDIVPSSNQITHIKVRPLIIQCCILHVDYVHL